MRTPSAIRQASVTAGCSFGHHLINMCVCVCYHGLPTSAPRPSLRLFTLGKAYVCDMKACEVSFAATVIDSVLC